MALFDKVKNNWYGSLVVNGQLECSIIDPEFMYIF